MMSERPLPVEASPTAAMPAPADDEPAGAPRVVDGERLLGPSGCVLIAHRGQFYRLYRTRAGKLILTK